MVSSGKPKSLTTMCSTGIPSMFTLLGQRDAFAGWYTYTGWMMVTCKRNIKAGMRYRHKQLGKSGDTQTNLEKNKPQAKRAFANKTKQSVSEGRPVNVRN